MAPPFARCVLRYVRAKTRGQRAARVDRSVDAFRCSAEQRNSLLLGVENLVVRLDGAVAALCASLRLGCSGSGCRVEALGSCGTALRVDDLGQLVACLLQFFLEHLQISVSAPGRPAQSLLGRMPFPWPRATPWGPRISHCPVLRAALSSPGLWTEDHKGQQVSSGLATQHRT